MTTDRHTEQNQSDHCPGCNNHCPLSDPQCGRGRMYQQMLEKGLAAPEVAPAGHRQQNEDLFGLFRRCTHLMARGRQGHKGFQLGQGQGRILGILSHHGGNMNQRILQEILQIRPASLSELLAKLEKNGHITRCKDEVDKRNSIITLTEQGQQQVSAHDTAHQEASQALFACLTEEEQAQLQLLLSKLADAWAQEHIPEEPLHEHLLGHLRQHLDGDDNPEDLLGHLAGQGAAHVLDHIQGHLSDAPDENHGSCSHPSGRGRGYGRGKGRGHHPFHKMHGSDGF